MMSSTTIKRKGDSNQRIALSFQLVCVISSAQLLFIEPIQCSSYLDDYFLPTAKLALNKIQQSFPNLAPNNQPVEASTTLAQVFDNVTTTPSGTIIQPSTTETENNLKKHQQQQNFFLDSNEQQKVNDELPIKNDFVKLNTQFEGQTQGSPDLPNNSPPVTIISSTLATNEDPTTSTGLSVAGDEFNLNVDGTFAPSSDQTNVIRLDSSPTNTGVSSAEASTTTTTATTTTSTTTTTTTTTAPPVVKQIEPFNLRDLGAKVTDDNKLTGGSQDNTLQEATIVASDTSSSSGSVSGSTNNINDEERQLQTGNAIVIESKSADEAAIKETELDAVAAVDASIGFGADFFASMSDPCYDEYGNARFCEPGFENAAFEKQVEVSSECGSPPSRFCTAYLNEHNDQIRNCHICDSQHPKKRHPAAYLTDMNNSNNPTCWVSAPINAATPSTNNNSASLGGQDNQQQQQQDNMISSPSKSDNVTLILNLDKKYEIIYISMQFCSIKPDSLAIYKSMDYGQTWLPYQFYSSQCRRMYGRPSKSSPATTNGSTTSSSTSSSSSKALAPGVEQYLEPSCVNSSQTSSSSQPNSGRIAFSPLGEGRASSGALSVEKSPVLQDWITATNIKIVLDRHQANWIHSNLVHTHHHSAVNNFNNSKTSGSIDNLTSNNNNNKQPEQQQQAANNELENSLTSPSNTFNYAMSDLTVGGRCKCNGHASRCIHSKEGKLQCDCRHNTAGRDCEKCATLHFDRPWARATQSDANPCQPCNCNGHSRKCRFDAELYRLSGRRSGGVCIGCRDNTAGRYCHYCREGFTRDHSKPMSDKEACKHCDCHLIGSLGRVCNQTTGQCPCKEGVTGLQCNRCAPGYQQSSSLSEPCLKLPENDINYEPSLTVDSEPDIDPSSTQTTNEQRQQQSNNNPPANNAANSIVEPSIVTENSNIAPPIDGRLNVRQGNSIINNNNNNNNRLDEQDTNIGSSIDDGDSISEFGDQPAQIGRPRSNKNYQQWNQQAGNNARHRNNYYRYSTQHHNNQNRHHNQFSAAPPILDEEDEFIETSNMRRVDNSMPSVVDDEYLPASATPIQGARSVYYPYNTRQSTVQQYKHHKYPPISDQFSRQNNQNRANQVSSSRINQANDILMKPMVNLDHGVDDINMNSPTAYDDLTDQQQANNYGGQIYNEDSFNHIHSPRNRVIQSSQRGRQNQLQQSNNVDRFRGYNNNNNNNNNRPIVEEAPAARSLVSCGDCQSSTRRLSSKQFCHSEFAIKATILNKFMAEDWTRFDVEIQDIFKSPSLDYLSRNIVVGGPTNYVVDNMLQADEGIIDRALQVNNNTQPIDRQQTQQQQQRTQQSGMGQQLGLNHKIKVGTIQSIWVPTEDLTCKCPKLKLRATYLLMGTIDAKENSANSLQLDRHGIALEWKSSLQEKLIKYQRRLAKGSLRC